MTEWEWKWQALPDGPGALLAYLETRASLTKEEGRPVSDIYYDTPSHELLEMGFGCRYRTSRGLSRLEIKYDDRLNAHEFSARKEWNLGAVALPEIAAQIKTFFRVTFHRTLGEDPVPCLHIEALRQKITVTTSHMTAELSLDQCLVYRAGNASHKESFQEWELEYKEGSETEFLELGRDLTARFSLRQAPGNKLQQGLALVGK